MQDPMIDNEEIRVPSLQWKGMSTWINDTKCDTKDIKDIQKPNLYARNPTHNGYSTMDLMAYP